MRRLAGVIVVLLITVGVGACSTKKDTPVASFTVTSTDVKNGEPLPAAQRKGGDVSPQLSWYGFPPATQSFTVTMYDRDAHFWHWAVVNLAPTTSAVESGLPLVPPSVGVLKTRCGRVGYAGAAPPPGSGVHHYEITVYALDVRRIDVPNAAAVSSAIKGHVLGKATIVATAES